MFDLLVQLMAAWNQVGFLLGGSFFLALGVLLCGARLYWRITGTRIRGTVMGVRRGAQDVYYPVYRYVSPAGNTVEVTSDSGSNDTSRMQTGRAVPLLLSDRRPDKAMDAGSFGIEICGLVVAVVGGFLVYIAMTMWPVTRATWIGVAAAAVYGAFRVRTWSIRQRNRLGILPRAGDDPARSALTPPQPLEQILTTAAAAKAPGARQPGPVVAWLLVAVGVALCALGVHNGRTLFHLQVAGKHASGVVKRLVSHSDSHNSASYYPIVRFTDASGSSVQFQGSVGSNPPWHHVGESVRVLYDPGSPGATAIIDAGLRNWLAASVSALFGVGLVAVGLRSRRSPAKAPSSIIAPVSTEPSQSATL